MSGTILAVIRKSEGIIQAGEPIVEVGNPEALEVVVDVLSYDAVQLRARGWFATPAGSSRMAPGCGVADDGDRDCKAPGSVPP